MGGWIAEGAELRQSNNPKSAFQMSGFIVCLNFTLNFHGGSQSMCFFKGFPFLPLGSGTVYVLWLHSSIGSHLTEPCDQATLPSAL